MYLLLTSFTYVYCHQGMDELELAEEAHRIRLAMLLAEEEELAIKAQKSASKMEAKAARALHKELMEEYEKTGNKDLLTGLASKTPQSVVSGARTPKSGHVSGLASAEFSRTASSARG